MAGRADDWGNTPLIVPPRRPIFFTKLLAMKHLMTFLSVLLFSQLLLEAAPENPASKPPAPYTPVKASSSKFRCLGRKADLGELLLPKQIYAAGEPLLASPVRIVMEPDLLAGVKGESRVAERSADKAAWEWTGESAAFRATVHLTGECDGFCWYAIELAPKQAVKLRSVRLEIPRLARTARYLHTANFTWTHKSGGLAECGGHWSDKFTPYVWLGDEERGLAWCAESARGWLLKDSAHAVGVETHGDVVVFSATLLDHEETLTAPFTIQFGLQASPVKPVSFTWRARARIMHNITYAACTPGPDGRMPLDTFQAEGVKTAVIHDDWTEYYGQVIPSADQRLRRLITECHKRHIRLLVYIGYGLARSAPELQGHHDNWSVMPLIPWNPSYRPEFRAFDATCARSDWADWLVKGVDKLFSEYDLDGLYFDGTSEAWRCENQAHGCGWKDASGKLHPDYPILATRQMMRRIADTVHAHRPDAILDVHMSASLTLPTLSFCDSYWNGEQFESLKVSDKFELPLDAFRTEFMGYAHGLDAEFLCYVNRPFTLNEAIALAWLHGVEVRPYPNTLAQISPIWRAMDSFGTCSARWQPYWSGSGAVAEDASVKASAYLRPGRTLLFVSHLKRAPLSTNVQLDRRRLHLARGPLQASDAISGAPVAIEGDELPLAFEGMNYRLIEVWDRHYQPRQVP